MTKRILPPKLSREQKIAIIAPADPVQGACNPDDIERGVQYLTEKGFTVELCTSVQSNSVGHNAGTPKQIAAEIHELVKRDDVGCIMAFWGGLSTNRVLDCIDYELLRSHPKIFVGFSDITALTTAITTKTGLVTFSGPGLISFAKPEPFDYTWEYFENLCITPENNLKVESSSEYADDEYFLREDNDHRIRKANSGIKVYKAGKAEGNVIAGNLQTLLVLVGTEYEPDVSGAILFIEEDESTKPVHFERFLCQCKQLGWFEKIHGLVIGRFTEQSEFTENDSLTMILDQHMSDVSFPILWNTDFGHSDPLFTIPHGGHAVIDSAEKSISFSRAVQ